MISALFYGYKISIDVLIDMKQFNNKNKKDKSSNLSVAIGIILIIGGVLSTVSPFNSILSYAFQKDYTEYDNNKAIKVLFIGNSYTSTHPLDILLMKISLSQKNQYYHVYSESNTQGGYTLSKHWNNGSALNDINKKKWNYVVLQGQSGMPLIGKNRSAFLKNAKKFDKEIKRSGARTVFFATWPYQNSKTANRLIKGNIPTDYNTHYRGIQSIYGKAAKTLNASAVYSAPLRHTAPKDINLYKEDGSHPSLAGSYLVALAFYKHLFSITKFDENTYIPSDLDKSVGKRLIKHVEDFGKK